MTLSSYIDSDWGGCPDTRSISGYVFLFARGAVNWSSKKQSTMALSSCEVEAVANTHASKEVVWLSLFLDEARYEHKATLMKSDNTSALDLIKKTLSIMSGPNTLTFSITLLC